MVPIDFGAILKKLDIRLWERAKINKKKITKTLAGKGKLVIQDSNFLFFGEELAKKYLDTLFENEMEISRTDLISQDILREDELTSKAALRRVKKVIAIEDYRILKSAYTILYFDKDETEDIAVEYMKIHTKKFEERGRRIYNQVESRFFERLFLPFLDEIESEISDISELQKTFQEFFDSIIKYNPYAIWVNDDTPVEKIYIKIFGRLISRSQEGMLIFGRKEKNIRKIERAIEQFINEFDNFTYFHKERKIRKLVAREYAIMNKEKL